MTGSPDRLGLWVAGFPGHWVTKCVSVPCLIGDCVKWSMKLTLMRQFYVAIYQLVREDNTVNVVSSFDCR
jgi:hypothetical protein